uniref:Protein recA n=1 Tax=Siphoviridae sp. ctgN495 TaxID=2825608 RepID=A0A8S5UC90_9CAUD|nr:MAG TPA: Protein recA [Siphoviridae sp. ctgN495]
MSLYDDIINKKKKEWSAENLMDGAKQSRGKKIPFSSPLMNWSTYGGIPRDKITEFFGEPGGGKSTSAVDICKNAYPIFKQEHEDRINYLRGVAKTGNKGAAAEMEELMENGPKKILYIDLEHSFDSQWASTIGIKPEEIEIMQPPDVVAEDILQTVQELICTGQVGLVILDSIPSLVPKAELEKKYGERTVASLAGLLTIFFRKIVPILTRYGCTLIFINQIRQNMDNPYVVKTPGGEAPKFYASMRILFQISNPVDFLGNELPKSSENPAGYIVNAKLVKQKSAPNDRKNASYFLMCQSGIREDMDFANLAMKKYGIIHKAAAWFSFADPYTGEVIEEDGKLVKVNGMAKVYEYLKSNKEYYAKLKKYIMDDIYGKSEDEINETSQESSEEL